MLPRHPGRFVPPSLLVAALLGGARGLAAQLPALAAGSRVRVAYEATPIRPVGYVVGTLVRLAGDTVALRLTAVTIDTIVLRDGVHLEVSAGHAPAPATQAHWSAMALGALAGGALTALTYHEKPNAFTPDYTPVVVLLGAGAGAGIGALVGASSHPAAPSTELWTAVPRGARTTP